MPDATIMAEYVDKRSGALVQQVANERAMQWDRRPHFFIAWPVPGHMVGGRSGDTAAEAIGKLS